jgi:hypothetical protein
MSSIFISHNHRDKPFVRRLAADLGAMGIKAWVDEAEIRVGDSIIAKISIALEELEYLGVVLSPNSVSSSWVREELQQALHSQISERRVKVLPILLSDCSIPVFLRDKLYADFRDEQNYEHALEQILESIGIDKSSVAGAALYDPFSERYGRLEWVYARPKIWHCIYCGWKCEELYNDYFCNICNSIRPFAGGSVTMKMCRNCEQWSLANASFCEWCGQRY